MAKEIKILLDAGHYANYNQSPVVKEYWESRRMWKLHLLLKAELEKYGFIVGVTRENENKDLAVTKRGKLARGYDMFLSLHSNAASSATVDRVDVFASYDCLADSHAFGLALAKTIASTMETAQKGFVKTRKSEKGDWEYYGVLRGAREVGCTHYYIVEHSFHTNKRSAKWLLDDDNLLKLAKAEAALIAEYYGKTKRIILGDINDDEKVDILDYALVKSAVMGNIRFDDSQKIAADMNGDGEIDIFDALELKEKITD